MGVRGQVAGPAAADGSGELLPPARAAAELLLKPREFELAEQLGLVRTVAVGEARRLRVERAEVARLRACEDFPDGLHERVRLVGATEGARLLGIAATRFGRLARAGCFVPVRFVVNRYRAVVWLYRAVELEEFAQREPELLAGRLPRGILALLEEQADRRPGAWRSRRVAALLERAGGPWEQAAVHAAVLPARDVAEVVPDARERERLDGLRPDLYPYRGGSEAAREAAESVLTADQEEEVLWHRLCLAMAARRARGEEAAARAPEPSRAGRQRGMWGWLTRRAAQPEEAAV